MKIEPKDGEFWVVAIDGPAREVVRVHRSGDRFKVYPCGDDEGYHVLRSNIIWVRKVKL